MKTYFEDFSAESMCDLNSSGILEIISSRKALYENTVSHQELSLEFKKYVNDLNIKAPELKKIIGELSDYAYHLEDQSFTDGYKAGILDLMTALTFNKLQITNAEYVSFKEAAAK